MSCVELKSNEVELDRKAPQGVSLVSQRETFLNVKYREDLPQRWMSGLGVV